MLKIQMYFAPDKSGWTFNIGDSPTNNGWGRCACDIYSCTLKNYFVYIYIVLFIAYIIEEHTLDSLLTTPVLSVIKSSIVVFTCGGEVFNECQC